MEEVEALATKSVGQLLREARLAKGISIETAEADTNIRGTFLSYLENDEYEKTPGEFFVKGAIRTYGNYLGLDGAKLVDQYKASSSGKSVADVESKGIREANTVTMKLQLKDKRDIGSGTGKFSLPKPSKMDIPWTQIAMGAVIIVILAALYFAVPALINWGKSLGTAKPATPTTTQSTVTTTKTEPAKQVAPVADKVVLELKASGRCWLEVNADGKVLAEIMLEPGDKKTYEAKDKLTVKYGNIGAVDITVNGQSMNPPGEHGVSNKVYTRENPQQDAPK
ncbi:MAG: DUF4115 domain-containing protein [Phascolarctobacterium sp.]|nr:DUF4115 domain-containing protein [Phascolarctobacterium sp.]